MINIPRGQTLLTLDPTPEQVERERFRQEHLRRVRFIVFGVWLKAYQDGDATLEIMLRETRKVLKKSVDQPTLERALGHLVDQALAMDPPKRGRGNKGRPRAFRRFLIDLVNAIVEKDGLSKTRAGESAFERASGFLQESTGVMISPRQIEDIYYKPGVIE